MPAIHFVKETLKAVLPTGLVRAVQAYRTRKKRARFANLSTREVFTTIYREGLWGGAAEPGGPFFSGSGSHNPEIVDTYVEAVRKVLSSFEEKPSVVDLGCGDFSVGARIRDLCGAYTACDIVEPLIAHNRERYKHLDVVFEALDLANDDLPKADLVFIRQVLQHLSNDEIARAVRKIAGSYRYLILTEHLPSKPGFVPNRDNPAGPDIRLLYGSGIDLTLPPFELKPSRSECLCEVPEYGGVIRTFFYELA